MTKHWLSSKSMTVLVEVDAVGIVRTAPPVAKRFIGQPYGNLVRWMERQGGFRAGLVR